MAVGDVVSAVVELSVPTHSTGYIVFQPAAGVGVLLRHIYALMAAAAAGSAVGVQHFDGVKAAELLTSSDTSPVVFYQTPFFISDTCYLRIRGYHIAGVTRTLTASWSGIQIK